MLIRRTTPGMSSSSAPPSRSSETPNSPRQSNTSPASSDSVDVLSQPEINIRQFSFYYGSFQALDSINMPIPQRRITALIGASGSGKSTLLRAINRMHDNTIGARAEGELIFNGENILDVQDLVTLRKRVGMIFQRSTAFPMS